ncbi:MAG: protein kinase [Acidobacteriota bacterium]
MIGETISRYRIVEKLGQGGMGEVFLADDVSLERKVALKFLPESMQTDPDARLRFLREAKAAAKLDHPLITRVYDTGEAEGKAFIVMEYVAGETLSARLARGPLPLDECLRIALQMAEALAEAHEKGIVHRDLKPANIMLTPLGHAKIMDFGLAKQVGAGDDQKTQQSTVTALTQSGAIMGTLAYMSPEQARGEQVDARSDIFSFGVVLFEALSGQHPFRRPSQIETLTAILRDEPAPLHMEAAASPQALRKLLSKATEKSAAERYQSMKDLALDLRKVKDELLPHRRPVWIVWALCAAAVLVVALLAWNWILARRPVSTSPVAARPTLSVLIADFENNTGDPIFNGALESSVATELERAPFITCYDPKEGHRVGAELQPGTNILKESLAELVAKRQEISVVLAGAISRQGAGYRITARAVDAATGKLIATREADASNKEGVIGVVGKLAAPIRKALGDTTPEGVQLAAEESFTAGSLEAAHQYAQAQECLWAGKDDEAIQHYSLAIQLDPDFGRAYAGLAVIYYGRSQVSDAERQYQKAMTKIGRMSEPEKYRTRGGYYLRKGNYPKAIEELSALVKQYPADTAGINNLAFATFLARDMARAVQECRRAVDQYPKIPFYRSNLALFSMYAGDFGIAVREADHVLEQNPGYELAYVARALSELAQENVEQSSQDYKRLEGKSVSGASRASMGLADIALYQGRTAVAAEILEKGIEGDRANNNASATARKLAALAQTRLIVGNTGLAMEAADQAISTAKEMGVQVEAARLYIEAGQDAKARALASKLSAQLEPDPQAYAKLIQGEIQLKGGNTQEAIKLFLEAKQIADTWIGRFDLGQAYLKAGAFTEADSEFEACLKRRGEATAVFLDDIPSYRYFPPALYYLGQAQEGLKSPAAAKSYQAFLAIKEKSVADPLVTDARHRLGSK